MDAEQRYTEEDEEPNFAVSDSVFYRINKMREVGYHLSLLLNDNAHKFKKSDSIVQRYGAMLSMDGTDTPFEVEVYNPHDDIPVVTSIEETDMDSYLDLVIKSKSITHEVKKEKEKHISTETD